MKRIYAIVVVLVLPVWIWTQEILSVEGEFYTVETDGRSEIAERYVDRLDAFYSFYDSFFRFAPDSDILPLNARLFTTKREYDRYLLVEADRTVDSFVYLQHSDRNNSEMVGYLLDPDFDNDEFSRLLSRYSLIQYVRTHIPNPPLWLQLGFAIYFEKCLYIDGKVVYKENMEWLNLLKEELQKRGGLSPQRRGTVAELLTLTQGRVDMEKESLYSRSWGLIHFLINSGNIEYTRLLWDSLSSLSATESREENELRLMNSSFRWVSIESLTDDLYSFYEDTLTYSDAVGLGVTHYELNEYEKAEQYFLKAVEEREGAPVPHYYIGLIKYSRGEYQQAREAYTKALDLKGDMGLIYHAMGINSYALGEIDEAILLLKKAYLVNPREDTHNSFDLMIELEEIRDAMKS